MAFFFGSRGSILFGLILSSSTTDARDTRQRTSLHYAAGVGHEEVVTALVTHAQSHPSSPSVSLNNNNNGSSHNNNNNNNGDCHVLVARDALGRTPLHYAAMGGHSVVLIALMQSAGNGLEEHGLTHYLPFDLVSFILVFRCVLASQ